MTRHRLPFLRLQPDTSLGLGCALLLSFQGAFAQVAPSSSSPETTAAPVAPVTDEVTTPTDGAAAPVEIWTTQAEVLPFSVRNEPGVFTRPVYRTQPRVDDGRPLNAHLFYRFQRAEGIPNGPGERYTSTVHEVSPGIAWALGEHWGLNYTPTFTWYSHDLLEDTVDHNVLLDWRTDYQGWRFDASHRYQRANNVLIETGSQTERESFQTAFGAILDLNTRLGWETRLGHYVRSSDMLNDFREYTAEQHLLYSLSERVRASAGVVYGYVTVDDGSDHQYLRPRLGVDYAPGEKLSLRGWAGLENRWYKNGIETTAPVYQIAANYRPVETTELTVSYNRSVTPAFFQDAVVRRRWLELSLTQRLLGRYFLSVSAGRQESSYSGLTTATISGRQDKATHYSVRLSTPIRDQGFVALFYEPEADNDSNRDDFSYSIRSWGAELGWQF